LQEEGLSDEVTCDGNPLYLTSTVTQLLWATESIMSVCRTVAANCWCKSGTCLGQLVVDSCSAHNEHEVNACFVAASGLLSRSWLHLVFMNLYYAKIVKRIKFLFITNQLRVAQLFGKFLAFYITEGSLPCPQDEISLRISILFA
jgi:hypothetical protein